MVLSLWITFSAFIILPKTDYTLTVIADGRSYTFSYPEIDLHNGQLYLKNSENILERIYLDTLVRATDATVLFTPNGEKKFTFTDERVGSQINVERLRTDILLALKRKTPTVTAKLQNIQPTVKREQLINQTFLRGEFSTYYGSSTQNRKHNVNLACCAINGTFLKSGESFSFNQTVGERTKERDYLEAKIISGGKFTDGVGGGVCQVSTTLYNCALLSGLTVTERHPHSLSVGYVEPSFDAMVSMYNDLKFTNTTDGLIFIEGVADGNTLTFRFYGFKQYAKITRISTVENTEEMEYDEIEDVDGSLCGELDEKIIIPSKPRLKSYATLVIEENGKRHTTILSKDTYGGIKGVKAKKPPISHIINE